jgi:hypothetical protein
MYGAIFGDIIGSIYEFNNIRTKNGSSTRRMESGWCDCWRERVVFPMLLQGG